MFRVQRLKFTFLNCPENFRLFMLIYFDQQKILFFVWGLKVPINLTILNTIIQIIYINQHFFGFFPNRQLHLCNFKPTENLFNQQRTILHPILILSSEQNFEILKIDKKCTFCLLNKSSIFYEKNTMAKNTEKNIFSEILGEIASV